MVESADLPAHQARFREIARPDEKFKRRYRDSYRTNSNSHLDDGVDVKMQSHDTVSLPGLPDFNAPSLCRSEIRKTAGGREDPQPYEYIISN